MTVDMVCKVKDIKQIAPDTMEMILTHPNLPFIKGGQFCNIKIPNADGNILRRPFCIAQTSSSGKDFVVVFAIKGEGTKKLGQVKKGDDLSVLLPLGNGFDLKSFKRIAVVGGGLGVLPLLSAVCDNKDKEFFSFLGFRNKDNIVKLSEFSKRCEKTTVFTDDGSFGMKGFVTDKLKDYLEEIKPDAIITCGPHSMLNAIKKLNFSLPVLVSMEERMACGVGVCLVCTCGVSGENKRVCKDGPVFDLSEVTL